MAFIAPVHAQGANVSLLYGYNTTAWVPLRTLPDGTLETTLNLSESTGLTPRLNNTYDIGATNFLWANLYVRTIRSMGPALSLFAGGSERITALAGGYVGINTTAPTQLLTVIGDINFTGSLYGDVSSASGQTNISVLYGANASATSQEIPIRADATSGALKIALSTTTAAGWNKAGAVVHTATSSDSVGIGTTAPQQTLEVVGTLNATGRIFLNGSTWIRGIAYTWPSADGSSGQFLQTSGAGVLSWAAVSGTNLSGGGATNRIVKWQNTTHLTNSVITDDGVSIGINASAPNALLSVRGAPASGLSLNVSDILYVNATGGNVGIGTTSPGPKLHIGGTGTTPTYSYASHGEGLLMNFGTDGAIRFADIVALSNTPAGQDNNIRFWSAPAGNGTATEKMRITHTGNVGIGTTSPNQALHVSGGNINVSSGNVFVTGAIVANGTTISSPVTAYAVTLANASNTASETDIITLTIPANTWLNGEYLFIRGVLAIKNNKGTAGALSPRLYVGGVSLALVNGSQSNSATEQVVPFGLVLQRGGSSVYLPQRSDTGGTTQANWQRRLMDSGQFGYPDVTGQAANFFAETPWTPTFTGSIIVKISVTLSAADATFYVNALGASAHKFGV